MWLLLASLMGCYVTESQIAVALDKDGDGYRDRTAGGEDCDDRDALVHPGAAEARGDGIDNDCDGAVDDVGTGSLQWFLDADDDGFGTLDQVVSACAAPEGFASRLGDCAPDNSAVHPGIAEDLCDQVDSDCDGLVDEDAEVFVYYPDADGDGLGDASAPLRSCSSAPVDYVLDATDCDDTDAGVAQYTFYADADGDGFGDEAASIEACAPGVGFVEDATDCDDRSDAVHPEAVEVCSNGVDDNCNGGADGCGFVGELVPTVIFPALGAREVLLAEFDGTPGKELLVSYDAGDVMRLQILDFVGIGFRVISDGALIRSGMLVDEIVGDSNYSDVLLATDSETLLLSGEALLYADVEANFQGTSGFRVVASDENGMRFVYSDVVGVSVMDGGAFAIPDGLGLISRGEWDRTPGDELLATRGVGEEVLVLDVMPGGTLVELASVPGMGASWGSDMDGDGAQEFVTFGASMFGYSSNTAAEPVVLVEVPGVLGGGLVASPTMPLVAGIRSFSMIEFAPLVDLQAGIEFADVVVAQKELVASGEIGDVNGDGFDDLVEIEEGELRVFLNGSL